MATANTWRGHRIVGNGAQWVVTKQPKKLSYSYSWWYRPKNVLSMVCTTGFASLCNVSISPEDTVQLGEKTLIRTTHPFWWSTPEDAVQISCWIRINPHSWKVILALSVNRKLLEPNKGVTLYPWKKFRASGDLFSFHMVSTNVGSWTCLLQRRTLSVVKKLPRIVLGIEKHPIGCQRRARLDQRYNRPTGIGALVTVQLLVNSLISLVLSHGSSQWNYQVHPKKTFHTIRPQSGQLATALSQHLQPSWRKQWATVATQQRVQDPYTLRCIPQIHGAKGFYCLRKRKS